MNSIAAYLVGRLPKPPAKEIAYQCSSEAPPVIIGPNDWPAIGRDEKNLRYQSASGVAAADVPRLKLKWAFAFPGGAPGPVVVASGRVFLSTGDGRIMSLDAKTGCRYWEFAAGGIIRSVSVGSSERPGAQPIVVFGDDRGFAKALDARTGKLLWATQATDHLLARITAPPIIWQDRVFMPISSIEDPISHDPRHECCTSQGGVAAFDLRTGKILWKRATLTKPATIVDPKARVGSRRYSPAGGAVFTPLTIDAARGYVYASTAESYDLNNPEGSYSIVAFDARNGQRVWSRQFLPDPAARAKICKETGDEECRNRFSMSAAVMLYRLANGKDLLIASSKSGMAYALDPDRKGKTVWQAKLAAGGSMGGIMYGPATDLASVYFPISDRDAVPPAKAGGLVAVDPGTGRVIWRRPAVEAKCRWGTSGCSSAQGAAPTVIPGIIFSSAWDGHLRAFATKDGALIWDVDTTSPVAGVNGLKAVGGQVSGYPVTAAYGQIFVTSGASSIARPGNALLVYSVDGR